MIRVYRLGSEVEPRLDLLMTKDPVEAEEQYFRLCRMRTPACGAVRVIPTDPVSLVCPPGYYRTDAGWPDPNREQEQPRRGLWAIDARDYTPPTPFQVRALAKLAGWSGQEAARRLGINPRVWRFYASAQDGRAMPFAEWYALRGMALAIDAAIE